MANAKIAHDSSTIDAVDTDTETNESELLAPPTTQHAVWVLPLNMGSCNGCDQQIMAMLAPRYELQRRGITLATSPRHADIILLTGTLTKRSLEAIQRVLAQVPDPHAVIAVGDCVLNGSVFRGSPELIPDAADLLGVNVEIAGNPPSPSEIILAIEEAAQLLDSAEEIDTEDDGDPEIDTDDVVEVTRS